MGVIETKVRAIVEDAMKKQMEGNPLVMVTGKGGVRDFVKAVSLEFTGSSKYTTFTMLNLFRAGWIRFLGKGMYQITV